MVPECVTNFARIFQVMIGTLLPPLIVGDVSGNFLASEAAPGIATEVTIVYHCALEMTEGRQYSCQQPKGLIEIIRLRLTQGEAWGPQFSRLPAN